MRIVTAAHPRTQWTRPFRDASVAKAPVLFPHELPDPESIDAAVILGADASVLDANEATLRLLKWTERCLAAKVPVLGICFGAQVLCLASGGYVVPRRTLRLETSIVPDWGCWPVDRPRLPRTAHYWHQHAMTAPMGSVVAMGPTGHADAFVAPGFTRSVGVQFHPEMSSERWLLMQRRRDATRVPVPFCDVAERHGATFLTSVLDWMLSCDRSAVPDDLAAPSQRQIRAA